MIRQYRYPLDDYLYELPAGLIDEGEGPSEAAIREMKEETGMDFEVYEGGNAAYLLLQFIHAKRDNPFAFLDYQKNEK